MKTNQNTEPMLDNKQSAEADGLVARLPLYTTRLVREASVAFSSRTTLSSPPEVADFLGAYFHERDREEFVVCLLDAAGALIGMASVSVGGLSSSIVEPRAVFRVAILANAAAIIVAHNHVSGNPEPSLHDIRITSQLVEAGKIMGVPVRDHLIITDIGYTSFAQNGMME